MSEYDIHRRSAARELLKIGAFAFTKSGSEMSVDLNKLLNSARTKLSTPTAFKNLAARFMQHWQVQNELSFDYILGVPPNGYDYAVALSRLSGRHFPLELDMHQLVGGNSNEYLKTYLPKPKRILLIEELSSNVTDIIKMVTALREKVGKTIDNVLALVDCEDGSSERLKEIGCKLGSIYTRTELLALREETEEKPSGYPTFAHA